MAEVRGRGRPPGRLNNDKLELRVAIQESVNEFVHTRRDRLRRDYVRDNPDATELEIIEYLDDRQPLHEEFDPVVRMAIMAADHRHDPSLRRQALADMAPYVRPKLKQVEHIEDPSMVADLERKNELAAELLAVLRVAGGGRSAASRGGPPPVPRDRDDEDEDDDE